MKNDPVSSEQFDSTDQIAVDSNDDFGLSRVDVRGLTIDAELLAEFPTRDIFRYKLLPLERHTDTVTIATSDPLNFEGLDELSSVTGYHLNPVLADADDLNQAIKDVLGVGGGTIGELVAQRSGEQVELLENLDDDGGFMDDSSQQASVVKLVNELLVDAIGQRASDVHLEPEDDGLIIRFRVDGLLRIAGVPTEISQFRDAIISRLKIMSRLNIAEKRLPQDGRMKMRISSREIDVRVSVIPMMHGEGIVLRLLDRSGMDFDLASLEFPSEMEKSFRRLIARPHGIVLVTGPTGSGKTTTLYSALAEINSATRKIITVEDPVEYSLPGIRQIQVHNKIGLTFASGLRSILRHDPDAILIGEIRDRETADSAIQAALTGHLVFSTLHTNDSCSAFTRLVDMGVEPYLVSSTVEAVLAQRLVRRLCPKCRVEFDISSWQPPSDFSDDSMATLWTANGCRHCHDTGYSGRAAIFEFLVTDSVTRQLCNEQASADQLRMHALKHGLMTLRQSGWEKVIDGTTSVDEVLRVCSSDLDE